jgi:hypothetical protein
MTLQPNFLRLATLPLASLLLIIAAAAFSPVCATKPQPNSDAERYVLEQVQKGKDADLGSKFPDDSRELRGSFVAALLTNRNANLKILPHGISIKGAVITGGLDMEGAEIPFDLSMEGCTFDKLVDLRDGHFARSLVFVNTQFSQGIKLDGTTVDFDFKAMACSFSSQWMSFEKMRVGRDFSIALSRFDIGTVSFQGTHIGGAFDAHNCIFIVTTVLFADMRLEGRFFAYQCQFIESRVYFFGSHFADVVLNESRFDEVEIVDFADMQADFISFDGVQFRTPSEIKMQQMTFKRLSPVDPAKLQFLLSKYDAVFYADLESWFRTHGYPDEADKIFIAKKRAERQQGCTNFWHQCDRGAFVWSLFQDALAGYGKRLENLLYWSLGFLIIGTLVFWKKDGMRLKDEKAVAHAPKYHAFWYSLDLFLPIIKLGEADVWTPKDDRRWANLYRKVHIIIGSLFVPIGLAAWTGIIK